MKYFVDGDQLCITKDDFINLQESPAVFYPLTSDIAKTVMAEGILAPSVGELMSIYNRLKQEGHEMLLVKTVAKAIFR